MSYTRLSGHGSNVMKAMNFLMCSWRLAEVGQLTPEIVRGKSGIIRPGKPTEFPDGLIGLVAAAGGPAEVGTTWREVEKLYEIAKLPAADQMKAAQDHLNSNLIFMENPTSAAKLEFAA